LVDKQNEMAKFNKGHKIWLGRKHTPESRLKMSRAKKGKKLTTEQLKNHSKGLIGKERPPLSLEWRKKIGIKSKGRIAGNKNPNWKGGIYKYNDALRKTLEYKLWRKAVFEKDNYTCQICGKPSNGDIEADHIKPFSLYPELRFAINNGRTLCKSCHKKYGWNYFREMNPKGKEIYANN